MATFAAATQKDLRAFAGAIENLIRPLEEAALGSGFTEVITITKGTDGNETRTSERKVRPELVANLDALMAAVETAKALVYK
ncbi:hypothetical protein [Pseudomonas phage DL62]|uniref:Uncharacterized protein n=1 Tax=Pseudomonas phage DL62 TaxID=1640972 RepID=A0A0F6WDG4_9CAUD|nr:minor head protein [Pseudomonas phage DL62]AKF13970.1 hypothetical protein [Pseudomonas phage DL62]